MPPSNDKDPIKITLEDLANVVTSDPVASTNAPGVTGAKVYGNITDPADPRVETPEERGSILLQAWFYLGLAGCLGALAGWGVAEHSFVDGAGQHWGNLVMVPLLLTLMCLGFGVAESIVERSFRKALLRGALALPLGIVLGFVFQFVAEIIYAIGMSMAIGMGAQTARNPSLWVVRGIAWMIFGAAGGVVYGIVGQSSKKATYGILGGVIGAGIGGLVFNPIALLTHGGAVSRAVGFGLLGLATGVAMGLVESALKDRWLYVTAGPLAGKQFILYKTQTVLGSDQQSDIYLFKDANILPQHAVVEINGARVQVRAFGETYVAGQPARTQVLVSGTSMQIGRYVFRYQERQRN